MHASWRKRLVDRLQTAIGTLAGGAMVLVFVAFGLNSCVRTSGKIPPNAVVVVLSERQPGEDWYRSIDSRSWGDFKKPPHANVVTSSEAEKLGLKPYPADVREGLFYEECGLLQEMLVRHDLLPARGDGSS